MNVPKTATPSSSLLQLRDMSLSQLSSKSFLYPSLRLWGGEARQGRLLMQRPLSGVLWLDRRSRHRWHPQNGWLYNASPLSFSSLLLMACSR